MTNRPSPHMRARRRMARLSLTLSTTVFLVLLLVGGGFSGRSSAAWDGAPRRVTVQAGDSLWGLAERYSPPRVDPRAYVDAIVRLNELRGTVYPGQRLRLPR